jgi:hypothetical protein
MHRGGMLTISFASVLCAIVTLSLLSGCATTKLLKYVGKNRWSKDRR